NYALEERIGNPDLFTGRKEELAYYLKWINDIKERKSQSTAILARRKLGKTALLERLFNITYSANAGVIPFYYEVKESKMCMADFCQDFFLTFIYQYIAFKSRKPEYLKPAERSNFDKVVEIAVKEGLDYLTPFIESTANAIAHDKLDLLWINVRETPATIAFRQKECIVQMIDEFQFLNEMIYRERSLKTKQDDMAAGYLSTAESKIAPLLVSGSWVGWLMNLLKMMLPARFKYKSLNNMPDDEAVEMVFKYSRRFDVPVSEETVYLIAQLTEGSPFYISSLLRSEYRDKDLTTVDGLARTLEFETLDPQGVIKSTWMEYVKTAFSRVNDRNAKRIVLYLFKHKGRELTRKEIMDDLELDITDELLEERLEALVKADIINQGQTNFDYRCVQDNIFDKVFRGVYQKEIEHFDVGDIKKEYLMAFDALNKKYLRLLGKFNCQKGYFSEFLILNRLKYRGAKQNKLLKSITLNLPADFNFCEYSRVWRYDGSLEYGREFNVDIFARSQIPGDYSIIGEVKNRESRKFSKQEVVAFERKFAAIKKLEKIEKAVGFIFSRRGFTKEAETYCHKKGIAYSEDENWLGKEREESKKYKRKVNKI
ncbi:MAG: hypothetical protein GY757_20165, partial [bacterium]|nr:hypothetical protein [bacterium]